MGNILETPSFKLAVYKRGPDKSRKLALLLPGRLDTKDYPDMRGHVDYLAEKGYLAVSFDPPGTWQSPGTIGMYTMTNYLRAINELIDYFGNRPTVLIGHSRGGTMACLAGTKNASVTHIISIMSRLDNSTISKKTKMQGFEVSFRDDPSGGKRKFVLPLGYFTDSLKYDVVDEMSRCTKPKLFVYGKKDEIISPEIVKRAYDGSIEPKRLVGVDSVHDYRLFPKIVEKINALIGNFLKDYP